MFGLENWYHITGTKVLPEGTNL